MDANEVLCGYQSHTHTQDSDGFYSSYAFSFRQYKGTVDATAPVTVI